MDFATIHSMVSTHSDPKANAAASLSDLCLWSATGPGETAVGAASVVFLRNWTTQIDAAFFCFVFFCFFIFGWLLFRTIPKRGYPLFWGRLDSPNGIFPLCFSFTPPQKGGTEPRKKRRTNKKKEKTPSELTFKHEM